MRICDLTTPIGRLARTTKELRQLVAQAKVHWLDQNAVEFEDIHVSPLLTTIAQASGAIERFHEVLREAEKECSETGSDWE